MSGSRPRVGINVSCSCGATLSARGPQALIDHALDKWWGMHEACSRRATTPPEEIERVLRHG